MKPYSPPDGRKCSDCGGLLASRYAERCRPCFLVWIARPASCIDCGVRFVKAGRRAQNRRCRDCYRRHRITVRAMCRSDGCERSVYAKGLCQSHYQVGWRASHAGTTQYDYASHALVTAMACAVCGYARMKSEVHRIVPQGPYVIGNMVPVCSRCHDEIERSLTECPAAWQPELSTPVEATQVHKTPARYGGTCQQCGRTGIRSVAKVCRPCYERRKRSIHTVIS